ncbi:ATP-binding cassette domain-containing protein [bacterium]|nr:ATP-binding cassette domain-containing protein [bacterium]
MCTEIHIDRISKAFQGKPVLDRVTFTIPAGTIFGLLGPNGAGKTTLMRIIVGILAPDAGTIHIPSDSHRRLKERIGYLPEERGLYMKMKVRDVLEFIASLKGLTAKQARPRIEAGLERLAVADYADYKVEQLSKGNQQRIQLLATLLHEPDLLILDEPFSGLDPVGVEQMGAILREEADRGAAVIVSTHRMEQAEQLCENIGLINHGQVIRQGNLQAIKQQENLNELELETATLPDGIDRLPGLTILGRENHSLFIRLEHNRPVPDVIRELSARFDLLEVKRRNTTLHDIFIQLVQEVQGDA